ENRDPAAAVAQNALLLQLLGEQRDGGAADPEHRREEFLRERDLIAADPVRALQQPAAQARGTIMDRVTGGDLLGFGPQRLGIAENQFADRRAVASGLLEPGGGNRR